jgi:hypothetical protein
LASDGALDFGGFRDDEVDRLLGELRAAQTPAERAERLPALAARLAQTWPFVPLVRPEPVGLVHRRVRNVIVHGGWLQLRHLALAEESPAD